MWQKTYSPLDNASRGRQQADPNSSTSFKPAGPAVPARCEQLQTLLSCANSESVGAGLACCCRKTPCGVKMAALVVCCECSKMKQFPTPSLDLPWLAGPLY